MKKLFFLIILIYSFTAGFSQSKMNIGFLNFKLAEGGDPTNEYDSRFTVEGEDIFFKVGYSQLFDPQEFIDDNFVVENEKFENYKTKYLSFKKFIGFAPGKKSEKLALFLYEYENIYLALITDADKVNEKTFQMFINTVKIDSKALLWNSYDLEIFSVLMPKSEVFIETDEFLEWFEIGMENEYYGDIFYTNINEDFKEKIDTINGKSIIFPLKVNGVYYKVNIRNDNNYLFSKKFAEKFKSGIKIYEYQPSDIVLNVSRTWAVNEDLSYNEWDWMFCFDGKSLYSWNTRRNLKDSKYKGVKGIPTAVGQFDNQTIYIGNDAGLIQMYGVWDQKPQSEIKAHSAKINRIQYVHSLGVVSCSDDKTIKVWEPEIIETEPEYIMKGHTEAVTCFDENGELIISGSKDNKLKIWNFEGEEINSLNDHNDDITAVRCFDKHEIVSASKNGEIIFRSFSELNKIKSIMLENGFVNCFNGKTEFEDYFSDYIACGTSTGEIIVWDKLTKEEKFRFKDTKPIKLLRFYKYGILSVNSDNIIKYWDIPQNRF